jgi:hypothetical protein
MLEVYNIIEFAKMLSCSLIRLKDAGRIRAVGVDHNFGEGLKGGQYNRECEDYSLCLNVCITNKQLSCHVSVGM